MSTSSSSSPTSATSSKWQESLTTTCSERQMRPPSFQIFSDRRGGRTAWSCTVTIDGKSIPARNWYSGEYVNNAKEDAAEVALRSLGVGSVPGGTTTPQNQRFSGAVGT